MISETKYILAQRNENISAQEMADELIGWAFDDEGMAKSQANFGAKIAPNSQVFKVTFYIEEITK